MKASRQLVVVGQEKQDIMTWQKEAGKAGRGVCWQLERGWGVLRS